MLELVTISTLNGVLYGMLLFLMASGLTLIFSMMGVLNFAHASFYMLGAFFGFQIAQMLGFWPAFLIAPVLVGGIGALVERYGLRYVHRHGPVVREHHLNLYTILTRARLEVKVRTDNCGAETMDGEGMAKRRGRRRCTVTDAASQISPFGLNRRY